MNHSSINKKHLIAGIGVVLVLFGLTWRASNFFFALFLWLWFAVLGIIVLYLLKRNTKPAKVGAALLEWNTIFLLFLPKHIQQGILELKKRERKET
jgi:hypothetical protein